MNKKIFKYDISTTQTFSISMPEGAEILTVQTQHGIARIWVLVDDTRHSTMRHFLIAGTGHPIEAINIKYIGTFHQSGGDFIWHLFELT